MVSAALAAAMLSACAGGTPETPSAVPTLPATPHPVSTSAPTATLEVVLPQGYPLSPQGPWLVYRTDEAVFIANPDGSGRRVLFDRPTFARDLEDLIAPTRSLLALYAFDDPEIRSGLRLSILRLPLGVEVFSTPLLSVDIQSALAEGSSPAVEAVTAVALDGSAAWSPSGQQLAFVAALDAPSSDLYLYDSVTDRSSRVSRGPNQIASLSWSPDGTWIAHQAVETFGSGAGWEVGAVWTISPDGQTLHRLYAPESSGEVFVGWSSGGSLVSYSSTPEGLRDLRAAGADGAVQNILVPDIFSDAAYDPVSGTAAYAVSESSGPGAEPGAYLWSPLRQDPLQVDARPWTSVEWAPGAGAFLLEGPSAILLVTPEGESHEITESGRAAASPDGRYLAVWSDGSLGGDAGIRLYTTDLRFVVELEDVPIDLAAWRPDSAGLMGVGDAGLIYYPVDGHPLAVDSAATPESGTKLGWVWP